MGSRSLGLRLEICRSCQRGIRVAYSNASTFSQTPDLYVAEKLTAPQGVPLKMVIGTGSVRFRPGEPSRIGFPEWTPARHSSGVMITISIFGCSRLHRSEQSNWVQKRLLLSIEIERRVKGKKKRSIAKG